MKTPTNQDVKHTSFNDDTKRKSLIYTVSLLKRKVLWIILVPFYFLSDAQCPDPPFGFCLSEPYFNTELHLYAIDVIITGFENEEASAINLEIDFNSDWIVDEASTEASGYSGLFDISPHVFMFSEGNVTVKGFHAPLTEGFALAEATNQTLFTIYFTAAARSCSDFTFGAHTLAVITSTSPFYAFCDGEIDGCEIDDYCIAGFTVGGTIESPVLDCDGGTNGGIPGVSVYITESEDVELFNCEAVTDTYGAYECDVVADLDYRIAPKNDYEPECGLSSLDIDIISDHLLGNDYFDYLWQWFAGDVNGSGTISTLDEVEIQKAILNDPITWSSWKFVPAETYNGLSIPGCPGGHCNTVPSYAPYIELEEVDEDMDDLDFVGIKTGDMNATCTECSDSYYPGPVVRVRADEISLNVSQTGQFDYEIAFENLPGKLKTMFFAFHCNAEPEITYFGLTNTGNFITAYKNGIYYVSYVYNGHENLENNVPFLRLHGNLGLIEQAGKPNQNEILTSENYANLKLNFKICRGFIYPNPARDHVTVLTELNGGAIVKLTLYTSLGERIESILLTSRLSSVNLDLAPGSYFYTITDFIGFRDCGVLLIQ